MTITGSLGVHAREVGAVDLTITSSNFELIDNELGKGGVESNLKVTGELRRPKIEGERQAPGGAAGGRQDTRALLRPVLRERDGGRRVGRSGDAEQPGRGGCDQPCAVERAGRAPPATSRELQAAAPAPTSPFAPVQLQVHVRIPENLVLRGKSLRPGRPTRAAIGDVNITVGGDVDITKEPDASDHPSRRG